jgi:hypothetical protein
MRQERAAARKPGAKVRGCSRGALCSETRSDTGENGGWLLAEYRAGLSEPKQCKGASEQPSTLLTRGCNTQPLHLDLPLEVDRAREVVRAWRL